MEIRRLLLFVALAWVILIVNVNLSRLLFPPAAPQPPADQPGEVAEKPAGDQAKEKTAKPQPDSPESSEETTDQENTTEPIPPIENQEPRAYHVLGSLDPSEKAPLIIYFDNQGAAVERVELVARDSKGEFQYRNLLKQSGYLGHLALRDEKPTGCRVQLVVPGSPAAEATSPTAKAPGLVPGDLITGVADQPIENQEGFQQAMEAFAPGENVTLQVQRTINDVTTTLTFTAKLTENPMELIAPQQRLSDKVFAKDGIVPSFLMGLHQAGSLNTPALEKEIQQLPSLRTSNWKARLIKGPGVEFRFVIDGQTAQQQGLTGGLEIIKRYRLTDRYHLELDITLRNLGDTPQKLSYRLDGPNGLPLEGWWYSNKVHPKMFKVAGSRDVIWRKPKTTQLMHGGAAIYKDKRKNPELPGNSIIGGNKKSTGLDYIGVDTQYFAAIMLNREESEGKAAAPMQIQDAATFQVGDPGELKGKNVRSVNSSFYLVSSLQEIAQDKQRTTRYRVFLGPKKKSVLTEYGLQRAIEYGWFSWVVKPMSTILHLFYAIVGNFGIAIIMLTIVVRAAMFPVSRKATRGAQMMQFLGPEMKKIAEKYKDDMEKRSRAQRELFSRYNYNPLSGCLLMFFQLPVFIGLYRCLSVDIELRDAPLIPGVDWCSNLAAPDMFWEWQQAVPWAMITDRATGWLGPYFNILPIITIALFILQQKLFTPPATDDQTRMQQKMMKYMMVFMGILFFKVASGLCLYFIVSSAWGITERKLLPKVGTPEEIATKARERVIQSQKKSPRRNGTNRQRPERKGNVKKKKR